MDKNVDLEGTASRRGATTSNIYIEALYYDT